MLLRGDGGSGYIRVDWFTPDGLGVWGDGRLTILGTDGYIELRKYVDIGGRPGADHLFLVDQHQTRYIDCRDVALPFGPQLLDDVRNRTETAMPQAHAFLASELALRAQAQARSRAAGRPSPRDRSPARRRRRPRHRPLAPAGVDRRSQIASKSWPCATSTPSAPTRSPRSTASRASSPTWPKCCAWTTWTSSTSARRRTCTSTQIQQVLDAGKHAICEKPLVSSLREVDELIARRGRLGPTHHADLPVPLRPRDAEAQAADRARHRRHAVPRHRRDGLAASTGVLRRALAREVGHRARRRAARPRHPQPRPAVLRARARRGGCSPTPPPASTPSRSRTAPAIALEMADGSAASLGVTLGLARGDHAATASRFSGLVAESNTRPYTNSGDPWTFVGDTPELDRADRGHAGRVPTAARALRRPVLSLLRRAADGWRAARHAGRCAAVDRDDHRDVLLGRDRPECDIAAEHGSPALHKLVAGRATEYPSFAASRCVRHCFCSRGHHWNWVARRERRQ